MEERQESHTFLLRKRSKKPVKIEFFPATQWRSKFRYGKRNMYPPPKLDMDWWRVRFRLRVNGKWYSPKGKKYQFYEHGEAMDVLGKLME